MKAVLFILRQPARIISLFLLAIFICQNNYLQAQEDFNFGSCAGGPATHTFPGVVVGGAMTPIVIEGTGGDGTTPAMTILKVSYESGGFEFDDCDNSGATPCTGSETLFDVTIAVTGGGSTVTINGTPNSAGITIIILVRAVQGATTCQRTYHLPMLSKPIDLVLVLDRSGSMAWGYDGSFSPPAGQRRWDGLVAGVGVLKAKLEGMGVLKTGDMLGMRMFATSPNVVVPAVPFNGGLVPAPANVSSLASVLAGVSPSGGTALGDGVIAGRDLVLPGTANNNKAMILFSDGVQNSGDEVKITAPNQYTHTNGNQKLSGPSNEIKIHTICLGSSGHNPMLMQGIASANGGQYLNTVAGAEADFNTFFTTHLANILAGNSPQLVDIRKGEFPVPASHTPSTIDQSFSVNKGTSSVAVTLLVPIRTETRFTSIQKDGIELIQFARQSVGEGYVSIAVRHPIRGLPGTRLDGEWKVTARLGSVPGSPFPYTMIIMIDNHIIDPVYSLGAKNFKVNETFNPKFSAQAGGKALKNATVQAIVVKPGDDLNHLLAEANVQFTVPPDDPGSPDVAKLAVLMKDTAFLNKIKSKNQVLSMAFNAGDSSYSASFNGLDVTGVYQVIYKVTTTDPVFGKIDRYHQESFYTRFPEIDLPNSQIVISTNAQGFSVITFHPRYKFKGTNRSVGLGWGETIQFEANGLKATNIVDKGDGSYEIVLNGKLDVPFKLDLAGEKVYDGKPGDLSCYGPNANFFQKIKCWLMSLGLPSWSIWIILLLILLLLLAILRRRRRP